jgi:Na+-transporting NADH:ubiquinone oxidoreductase subunit F
VTAVLVGVVMFTGVILALVAVLLAARKRLVASGDVSIVVNDDPTRAFKTPAGNTLLGALAANGIFIPSACGGKGACGVCEVVVKEGGGDILPTETGFITPGEARHGCRLACQVKVKRDMRIELPAEVFSVAMWNCRVVSNHNVATFIKELVLALPEGESVPFRAGGYVQVECPPHTVNFRDMVVEPPFNEDWDKFDLWRFQSVVAEPTRWPTTRWKKAC